MTTLKGAISAADAFVAELRPPNFSAPRRSFEAAVEKSIGPFNELDAKLPEGVDWNQLVRRAMRGGIAGSNGEGGFTLRELRLLAWALWIRADGGCIAANPPLLTQYLQTIAALKKRSHFRALASSYFWNFTPDGPGISAVAKTLRKLLEIAPPKWEERHQRWNIFACPGAVQMVARHFMNAGSDEQAIAEAAKRIGLEKILVQGGMSKAAFCAALQGYVRAPNLELLGQLAVWRKFAAKEEKFCNSAYAEGLLLPWTGDTPPEDVKSETMRALDDSHDDPRVHPVNWAGVKDEAKNVMFRWLTGVSVEQFFHVIDKIGGPGGHMWPARRKFWLSYYKHGHMLDAWAAFGGAGLNYLRGSREVAYAALNGALYDHAVLLMRIGDLTIADWNQNGMCRIWNRGNKYAPQFYRRTYRAEALRQGSNGAFRHDPSGHWRGYVAQYIRDSAGIIMPAREYS